MKRANLKNAIDLTALIVLGTSVAVLSLTVKSVYAGCDSGLGIFDPTCPGRPLGRPREDTGDTLIDGEAEMNANIQRRSGKFLKNSLSGKCIDIAGAPGNANGSRLQLWDCERSGSNRDNGSPTDQKWILTRDGFIINPLSGKCIDVAGAPGNANGSSLQLWGCERSGSNRDNGSPTDQKWTLTSDGFLRNQLSGKCIDVAGAPGNTNGAPLTLWDCESSGLNRDNGSSTDQRWTLQ